MPTMQAQDQARGTAPGAPVGSRPACTIDTRVPLLHHRPVTVPEGTRVASDAALFPNRSSLGAYALFLPLRAVRMFFLLPPT